MDENSNEKSEKEEPQTDEPLKEEPAKEEPVKQEPLKQEPLKEETPKEEPLKEEPQAEEPKKEVKVQSTEKLNFLCALGLITTFTYTEMQNKRAERKRRSTANPQFVYSSLEVPTKRKRHSYLQSVGNIPQTRQTTARKNGPSPPPVKVVPTKSTSPPTRAVMKSLIPVQKSTTRPNILRNVSESKVFVNKSKMGNGPKQIQLPISAIKSVQSIGSKAVHIPGLPSSLTIERIGNDSAVCISCRNPGTLTVCGNCASNYHVSCHSISPAPPRICPKCALMEEEEIEDGEDVDEEEEDSRAPFKKDEEFEEKERERYELRERNSDLRLQVYELEKRSQLLGQSLQLQHRTRQELLGKQEKTQRSIKRLVDFIKLMQVRKSGDSPAASVSASFPLQPSSSHSPQTTSLHQPSTSRKSDLHHRASPNNERATHPILPSSSISCPDRASPTSGQNLKCPTPISCQSAVPSQKNISHTSSSKKSQNHPEVQASPPTSKVVPQCSTINCKPHQVTTLVLRTKSLSPSPNTSLVTVRSKLAVQYPLSTASSIQKTPPALPNTSWNDRPSTAESPRLNNHEPSSVSTNCDLPEPQTSCYPRTMQNQGNSYKLDCQLTQRKQPASVVIQSIGHQESVVFSTHCSQAITSPISSPIILANHETLVQATKTAQPSGNSCIVKTTNWSQVGQTSLRPNCSAVPSRNSSST